MIKRLALLCLTVVAFSAAAPKPANALACFPGLQFLCDLIDADTLIKSATSRLKIGIDSFLLQLKLEHGKKLTTAEATLEMAGGLRSAQNDVNRMYMPGPTGASCAIASAASVYLSGGTGAQPQAGDYPGPPGTGRGPSVSRPARKPLGSFRTASGGRRDPGIALTEMGDTSGDTADALAREYVAAADRAETDCRNNLPAGSECENQWKKVQADFIERMNFYGPDQANDKFHDADIRAPTLLSTDTLGINQANTATSAGLYLDSNGKVATGTGTGTKNMVSAAYDFCHNLTDPTILAPNRGNARAQDLNRQAHAVQRAGWDARLSLANTICNEAVGRRLPKAWAKTDATDQNGGWLLQTMQELRKTTCKADGNATGIDCDKSENEYTAKTLQFSDYEALKTLMTKLLASNISAQFDGASNNPDALKRLIQADQLAVMMNYRIWELQERLNLVKAAQLAQQVENEKTDPAVAGSVQ